MIHQLKSPKSTSKAKRVGRGYGSGKGGHTTGRGQKGQKSRAGYSSPRKLFEGASNPIIKRIPKLKGFSRGKFTNYVEVKFNVSDLNKLPENIEISPKNLDKLGIVSTKSKRVKVKILGDGEITKKFTIKNLNCSNTARQKIEKAGGKVIND
jgi:large subunit ribosomal protein L15